MTMTNTMPVETIVSLRVGHVTFEVSWRTCCINCIGFVFAMIRILLSFRVVQRICGGRGSRARTRDLRFWRPPLYQLSYTPICRDLARALPSTTRMFAPLLLAEPYSTILATTPAPTVRPPSRIAKRRPWSIAIGVINSTVIDMLSPGITISVFAGSSTMPVTSVVRK